jgi:xanthine dehydrogenase accessory factor
MNASVASFDSTDCDRLFQAQAGDWLQPLHDWPTAALRSLHTGGTVARVVVASVRGSAPREPGACMLIERTQTFGTIGGGQLEWAAIEAGRKLLADPNAPAVRIDKLVLGTQLAQCCGGVVELWIERYTQADLRFLTEAAQAMQSGAASLVGILENGRVSRRITREPGLPQARAQLARTQDGHESLLERLNEPSPQLWLYGAGHVGQALMRLLADLPVRVTWIDSRAQLFPVDLPQRIQVMCVPDPLDTVAAAPGGTHFLVMTHSHPLDYALCRTILEQGNHAWAGVIGSKSKAARFRSRFVADGLSPAQIARLECPIGIDGIDSKAPAVIAIAVAAQLLQVFDSGCHAAKEDFSTLEHVRCRGECNACANARQVS